MIIHYNCTIGSFLLHSFLLIYHPYPPSFHEMIFTLVIYRIHLLLPLNSTRITHKNNIRPRHVLTRHIENVVVLVSTMINSPRPYIIIGAYLCT